MSSIFIQRRLRRNEFDISQLDLTELGRVILVLGEPGAGKSELLAEIGKTLEVQPRSASRFRHQNGDTGTGPLIIDALDEVVRLDPDAIDPIIVKASETQAKLVILSSRSSEWDSARTRLIEECFGEKPVVVTLLPFSEAEQKTLFEAEFPKENFCEFVDEVERFELRPLLGNPQFLKLFAEAFIQSDRRFVNKLQIFDDAVVRLTSEREDSPKQKGRASIESIKAVGEEVFAKILLSGTSGVSLSEDPNDQDFAYLNALSEKDHLLLRSTIDTRLFKPTIVPGCHEPIHRIVAEYCAARHLVRRIDDPSDLLSLRRVLALVAPNGVVRDELRGLLGWMAALGSREVQTACIEVDPYAVLANGDPSQLAHPSKEFLLQRLRSLSEVDPYFRRSDSWRRFSVAGFFHSSMVDLLRNEIVGCNVVEELRDLLLELLQGSDATPGLAPELRSLLLNKDCPRSSRIRVQRLLLELPEHDHRADFLALVTLGDRTSLRIAAETAPLYPAEVLHKEDKLFLLRASARHSDRDRRLNDQYVEHRYYVQAFTENLALGDVIWLLDEMTRNLTCTCGAKSPHLCTCLQSTSRIIGQLLDRYFALVKKPHDTEQIWSWVKDLHFNSQETGQNSLAVKSLREDDALRHAIHRVAFRGHSSTDDVWHMRMKLSMSYGHSGLYLIQGDWLALVNYAFETSNDVLWEGFYCRHNRYATDKGPDELRSRMRIQARERPYLLRIWSRNEREAREAEKRQHVRWGRSHRKYERRQAEQYDKTKSYFEKNRKRILAGTDWPALRMTADCYLFQPDKIGEIYDDMADAECALRNSFPFMKPHVPTLASLVDKTPYALRVLHAACLAHFRQAGNLDAVETNVLRAVKTDLCKCDGLNEEELEKLTSAIDRRIFQTTDDIELFARTLFEPQLYRKSNAATDVGRLSYDSAFLPVRDKLALEWLIKFQEMPWYARDTLFDICAKYGDRTALKTLINQRCAAFVRNDIASDEQRKTQDFWFLRGLFFLDDPPPEVWERFQSDREAVFMVEARAGRFGRRENEFWPSLSAHKIFRILDMYVETWPKVFLPSSYGTGDPPEETAYRFLSEIVWSIDQDSPDQSIPIYDRLLSDIRFAEFHNDLKSLRASAIRKKSLSDFKPPSITEIVDMLDRNRLATVEDLRTLLVEELEKLEVWIRNNETNPLATFYENGEHVNENTARDRIVDGLQGRMSALNLNVVIERYMADQNRCDIAASATIAGSQKLLVVEVKGQWHRELFSAAAEQLHHRYSSHPDAAQQGIYLVLWFGPEVPIAGKQQLSIVSPDALRKAIVEVMPQDLRHQIDVIVINLSRN